jgi:hypothetical protein
MRILIAGMVLALAFLGGGGATAQISPAPSSPALGKSAETAAPSDVESLRERAAAFWAARVAEDINKQWELLEPRGRGRMTALQYAAGRGAVKYLAYQVEDATVNGYFSTVRVRLMVQPVLAVAGIVTKEGVAPSAAVVSDKWVKIQGTWYRSLEADQAR